MTDYRTVFSSRKTLAVEITKDAEVVVRAPYRTGKRQIEEFLQQHSRWIETHLRKVKGKIAQRPVFTEDDIEELRKKAQQVIPQRVRLYSEIMKLYPTGIKITSAKTRYGSCSGKNSLCFSLYLMTKDEAFIDYVVVHELAHIKYKNHSRQFHEFVARYSPVNPKDYR